MTLPNDDMSNIADPGSFEPETHDSGDLDADHDQLARDPLDRDSDRDADRGVGGDPTDPATAGTPLGPPD
jgi:hypothetical protein